MFVEKLGEEIGVYSIVDMVDVNGTNCQIKTLKYTTNLSNEQEKLSKVTLELNAIAASKLELEYIIDQIENLE